MKIYFVFFLALVLSESVLGQASYKLSLYGKIHLLNGQSVYLEYFENGKDIIDSTIINNDNFKFYFKNKDAKLAKLSVNRLSGFKLVLIDKSTEVLIDTTAIWKSKIISGNVSLNFEKDNNYIYETQLALSKGYKQLYKTKNSDIVSYKRDSAYLKSLGDSVMLYKINYIEGRPKSVISLFYLKDVFYLLGNSRVEVLLNSLDQTIKKHNLYDYLYGEVEKSKLTRVGNLIPSLYLKKVSGQIITLDSLSSRYLILNFWGTWCGPCITELPFLSQLYNANNRSKLEIISIAYESRDSKPENISAFLEQKKIHWNNIICYKDLGDYNSNLVKKFGITVFPTNIFIDLSSKKIIWVSNGISNIKELEVILNALK